MEDTVKSHQGGHGITQQISRTDLLTLSEKYQLLRQLKVGRIDIFILPSDLKEHLKRIN